MATQPYSFGRDEAPQGGRTIANHGDIAIQVTKIDAAANSVTGIAVSKPEKPEITMSFATVGEYADFYANRSRFTSADARQQEASKQLAKQPSVKGLQRNSVELNDVVQFQSVKELPDGKMIARWANAVTTNGQGADAYRRMDVMISIPKDNASTQGKFERRSARAYDLEGTVPASADVLERMTDAKVRRFDGSELGGEMRNSVLVAISDGVDVKTTAIDMPWGKGGPAKGTDALISRPMDNYNYLQVSALAGKIGIPFDNLKFAEQGSRNAPQDIAKATESARDIYDASARGGVGVTITPGVVGDLMLHIKQNVMKREEQAAGNSRAVSLSERGFFKADIALMTNEGGTNRETGEVYPDTVAFKQILPSEFLQPTNDEKFIRRKTGDLGHDAMTVAVEKDRDAVFAPAAGYKPDISATRRQEPEKKQESELSTSGPGF